MYQFHVHVSIMRDKLYSFYIKHINSNVSW